jgi:hypothetical protein
MQSLLLMRLPSWCHKQKPGLCGRHHDMTVMDISVTNDHGYVRWLSFCTFSFSHCVVCSSSIYEFWLPLLVSSNSSSTYRTDFPVLAWNGNHFVLRNGDNSDKKIYIQVGNWQMVYCNIYRIYRFVISNIIYGSNILSSWRVLKYL